jgi:hypothetical protein
LSLKFGNVIALWCCNGVVIGVVIDHSIDVIQIDVILEGGSLLWLARLATKKPSLRLVRAATKNPSLARAATKKPSLRLVRAAAKKTTSRWYLSTCVQYTTLQFHVCIMTTQCYWIRVKLFI